VREISGATKWREKKDEQDARDFGGAGSDSAQTHGDDREGEKKRRRNVAFSILSAHDRQRSGRTGGLSANTPAAQRALAPLAGRYASAMPDGEDAGRDASNRS